MTQPYPGRVRPSYMPQPGDRQTGDSPPQRDSLVTPPAQPYLRAVPDREYERPPGVPHPDSRAELEHHRFQARLDSTAPRVPWDVFTKFFDWEQGQHVAVIGPNGQGKTTLLISLLPFRRYVTVFATKPVDRTLDSLAASGYDVYEEWLRVPAEKSPRRILWPNARDIDSENTQREVFERAFQSIYREGGWTLTIDEGWFLSEVLDQKRRMRTMWTQGRSLGISFVVGTQRPAWVPMEMYDESTHLFIFRLTEKAAVDRVANLGQADADFARKCIRTLEKHQCLYVNTRTGEMLRTRAPAPQYKANDDAPEKDEEVNNT